MSTIVLRSVKGTPLTNTEVDDNFNNLNTDKIQFGSSISAGTANGVLFLNASKVLTSGSALTFDGSTLNVTRPSTEGLVLELDSAGASTRTLEISSFTNSVAGAGWSFNASSSAGVLAFSTNSTEGMRLTSTGLGIGTSSPVGKLDVSGTTYSRFFNTTAPTLDNDTHAGEALYLRSGGTAGAENVQAVLAFGKADSSSQRSGAAIASIQTTSDTDQIGLAFYVSASTSSLQTMSERFRIGTTEAVFNEVSADYDFRVESDTNTHALFLEGSSGNVGIGTSSPSGASGTTLAINGVAGQARLALKNTSTGDASGDGLQIALDNTAGGIEMRENLPLYFTTNNTERMRIDSSGNVGIGTSSPTTKLDVVGEALIQGRLQVTAASPELLLTVPAGGLDSRIYNDGSGNLIFGNGTNSVTPTERMRITSAGNVGIGTSSPLTALNVNGTGGELIRLSVTIDSGTIQEPALGFATGVTNTYPAAKISALEYDASDSRASLLFYTRDSNTDVAPTERMRLDSFGNLGLGVTPSAWGTTFKALQVGGGGTVSGSTTQAQFSHNWVSTSTGDKYISTAAATAYTQTAGQHLWYTAPSGTAGNAISFTQAMTLDASGRLGIGTTSPSQRLHVDGRIRVSTDNSNGGDIAVDSSGLAFSTLGTTQPIVFLRNNYATESARIDSSGNLLVGQTSTGSGGLVNSNSAALTLGSNGSCWTMNHSATSAGSLFAQFGYSGTKIGSITVATSSTVAYNTSSDYRLKNITGPITTSGAYIDSLNPVEGTWKIDGSTFVGLIAHEVQEASRTPVATGVKDGEEMQGMDYSSAEIIANLIAEVKALRTRVAALESI